MTRSIDSKRILAVDPGKHGCGIACFDYGLGPAVSGPNGVDLLFAKFVALPDEALDGPAACVALACAIEEVLRGNEVRPEFVPDVVVVETMKVYTSGKARPSDLLHLHGVAMAVCARFPGAKHVGVDAGIWKGQVPRDVMSARIAAKIEAREGWKAKIVVPRRATHLNDVHHAVGLGLFITERGASLLKTAA